MQGTGIEVQVDCMLQSIIHLSDLELHHHPIAKTPSDRLPLRPLKEFFFFGPSALNLWLSGLVLFSVVATCNPCTINHLFCCVHWWIKNKQINIASIYQNIAAYHTVNFILWTWWYPNDNRLKHSSALPIFPLFIRIAEERVTFLHTNCIRYLLQSSSRK